MLSFCTEMYSIQLTIIVLHVLGNWLIDNTDEAGRQNDWFQKIYYSDVARSEKNFDSFHQIIHSRIFIPFFPLQTQFSRYKRQQSYVVNSSMNLDVKKGVRA